MDNIKKTRTIAIIILTLSTLGIVAFILYSTLVFRVTGTSPDPEKFPTIAPYIDIYFSKPVDAVTSYTLNKENNGTISISENKIRYSPSSIYDSDETYNLSLKGIRSKSGDVIDYTYTFTAVYMNFSDIPEDIRKASIEKSSSGQIDDPFFNNYFPMQTPDFQIEYSRNGATGADKKSLYITFLREVYNYDTETKYTLPDNEAEALRTKVIEYIKKRGGTPDEYNIYFANEYLNGKYPQKDALH